MLAQLLLGLMVDAPLGETWRRVWRAVVVIGVTLLGVAALTAAMWLLVQTAQYGWQTADWDRMRSAGILPIYGLYFLFFPLVYLVARRAVPRRVQRALLDTLEGDDTQLAKQAIPQPEPLSSEELARLGTERLRLTPLRPLEGGYYASNNINLALLLFGLCIEQSGTVIMQVLEALGIQETWHLFGFSVFDLTIPFIIIGFVIVILGLVALPGTVLLHRLRVSVDVRGLTWQRRGLWRPSRRAEWSGIRAFWRASYSPQYATVPAASFIVETEAGVFGWTLDSLSKDAEYTASEQLTRLIVTRTGLPLHDLAPLMADLAWPKAKFKHLRHSTLPEPIKASLLKILRPGRRVLWLILPMLALMAMFIGGPMLADSRLQATQQDYFAGLAPHITAQTPLYQDALSAENGQWPVSEPSAANHQQRHVYLGGAYTMSGQSGQSVIAFDPQRYGDAAVAVTVREPGATGQDDGVGLVLRADAEQRNFIAFYVTSDGTYSFQHYLDIPGNPDDSWEYGFSGASSAIHRGVGATNRLLVLARGEVYLLYVNGVLVSSVPGSTNGPHNALASGYAGVYLNDGATTGSYSDFAVYPIQSLPSLSYV